MEEKQPLNQLFPVFLKLDCLQTLLVGAGNVGLEKLTSLVTNSPGASITIVAPEIKKEIREIAQAHPGCTLLQRDFTETDLDGKHFVICATDNRALHEEIKKMTTERNIIVNVADTPDLCDCYLGSIVRKGSVKIAISTNGKSPTIAKRIKELMTELLPDELEDLLDNMQQIRNSIKGDFGEKVRRLNEITKDLSLSDTEKE